MTRRAGFTIFELVIASGLIAVVALVMVITLARRKSQTELDTTAQRVAALLREAQGRSMTQAMTFAWGVHFENSTGTTPFYALFYSAYSSSTRVGYYRLPVAVGYVTSSLASGAAKEIVFGQISGAAVASDSISIYLVGDPARSSTVSVASSGAVGY